MLIHVHESAVQAVVSGSGAERWHDCMENLLVAHFQGDHVVSLRTEDVGALQSLPLSRRARRALFHIDESFAQIAGLREDLPWSIEVGIGPSFDGTARDENGRKIIRLDLGAFDHTNKSACTFMLGENLTDAELFFEFALIMRAARRWDAVDVVHEKHGGGGDTTVREYQSAANLGRIVLAIADTDLRHPSGTHGETYRKVEEAARERPSHQRVRALHVRTAEGLVPIKIYREVLSSSPERQTSIERIEMLLGSAPTDVLRYAHLKDGLRLHQVHHPKSKAEGEYWLAIAKSLHRDGCKRPARDECKTREQCGCYVVDALGKDALDRVVKWLREQKSKKALAGRFGLSKDSRTELAVLADEVLAWGIALGPLQT